MAVKLCFVIHIYQDEHLAERLLGQLMSYYPLPSAQIICIGDGPVRPRFERFCIANQVLLVQDDRLKLMKYGGQWLARMFRLFLALSSAPVLIKLDPDCQMWRSFNSLPDADADWFGSVNDWAFRDRPFVRGGCQGFSRWAVQLLLNKDLLADPIYTEPPYGYQRYGLFAHSDEQKSEEWLSLCDWILADVMFQLGISPTHWGEVCIQFRERLPENFAEFAVSHPHRD